MTPGPWHLCLFIIIYVYVYLCTIVVMSREFTECKVLNVVAVELIHVQK